MTFTLKSSAFSDRGTIPEQYTCDGRNVSPPLSWEDAPAGTRQFALILDDPDATRGVFNHWVIYGIHAGTASLPEYVRNNEEGPDGSRQGKNGGGRTGYSGPCPPFGSGTHRYIFNLYALDAELDLPAGQDKAALLNAMEGHMIELVQLTGLYSRRPPAEEPKGNAR